MASYDPAGASFGACHIRAGDLAVLEVLFNGTSGVHWDCNAGWNSAAREWFGLTAAEGAGDGGAAAEQIELSNNSLSGCLPPSLGALSRLVKLDLSDNSLAGPIPPPVGQCASLRALALDKNGSP